MQDRTILVIDDDVSMRHLLMGALKAAGANAHEAINGREGLRRFFELRPELVILDVMMPDMDGWQVCARIREFSEVPIIFLTALGDDHQVVQGLDSGAVDYVTKPFSIRVLLARARAALRASAAASPQATVSGYQDDYLGVDLDEHRVVVRGESVKLTATEFQLLAYLVKNANRLLTYAQILEHIWGWEYRNSPDLVHVHMSNLRRKLEKDSKQPEYLLTEHGVGYRFEKKADS